MGPGPDRPELERLMRESKEAVERMTPFQRAEMTHEQARSFAIGNVAMDGSQTREAVAAHVDAMPEYVLVAGMRARIDELLKANNEWRERAIAAESKLKERVLADAESKFNDALSAVEARLIGRIEVAETAMNDVRASLGIVENRVGSVVRDVAAMNRKGIFTDHFS